MDTPCHRGAPRWIKPTKEEREAHKVPVKDRARFQLIGSHTKGTGDPNHLIGVVREGDVVAYWMTGRQKRKEILKGNVRASLYFILRYAHLAVAVRKQNDEKLRLYSSEALRGPNMLDDLSDMKDYSFDVYRLDKADRLDLKRLREFTAVSVAKSNKWIGYNFLGMLGIWSNMLEPESQSDIGNDYICSTSVAAALHYSGLDLDRVRCCEALNMISPKRVLMSQGRLFKPGEPKCCKP